MSAFEQLEWAATFNVRHDIGTDLLLSPKTPQGVDQSADRSTGQGRQTAFRDKTNVAKGELEGWWFRDDKRSHVDIWARHALPFLIILHDEEQQETYWAHVTPEVLHIVLALPDSTFHASWDKEKWLKKLTERKRDWRRA